MGKKRVLKVAKRIRPEDFPEAERQTAREIAKFMRGQVDKIPSSSVLAPTLKESAEKWEEVVGYIDIMDRVERYGSST